MENIMEDEWINPDPPNPVIILGTATQATQTEAPCSDSDPVFGSVAWQEKYNKARWRAFCAPKLFSRAKPTTFDHKAALRDFCKRKGINSTLGKYTTGRVWEITYKSQYGEPGETYTRTVIETAKMVKDGVSSITEPSPSPNDIVKAELVTQIDDYGPWIRYGDRESCHLAA